MVESNEQANEQGTPIANPEEVTPETIEENKNMSGDEREDR